MTARLALATLAALLLPLGSQAVAQEAPEPPAVISPLKVEPERNGVNLATGRIDLDIPSLGVPAAPRLRFDKVQNWSPYMHGTINAGSGEQMPVASYSVTTTASSSESFKCLDWDCTSVTFSGSTFRSGGAQHQTGTYTRAGSGERYHFTVVSTNSAGNGTRTVQSYASRIDYADGEQITFGYDSAGCGLAVCYRPNRIETNVGYFITVTYQSNDINSMLWPMPLDAKLYAAGDPNTALQSLHYATNLNTGITTVTDIAGRVWNIAGANNAVGGLVETPSGSVQLPTEGSPSVTIAVASNAPLVGSFVRDGVTWTYTYTNPVQRPCTVTFCDPFGGYIYSNVTATGPNGYSMSYAIGQIEGWVNVVAASTDALGRLTDYDHDQWGRITKVTVPEGNSTQLVYDSCGNITTKTSVAKTGSGLANIVETAAYPLDDTCPTILSYRPTSSTDARGKVTNYTWNSAGQLTQQDDPADAAGVRRRTINDYTVTNSLSRKSRTRVCAAGATPLTCSGTPLSQTDYTYVGNTFLPATVTVTDNGNCTPTCVTETTSYTYDPAGRVTSIQGPQNGAPGTKYFRYDSVGRKIWEIGVADEFDPLIAKRLAKRFTYRDSDDKVTKVETGTVTCPTNCNTDPLTLTLLEQTDTTYDSRRYPIRELTSAGGTAYRITDRSFLDRGLADCTTVRMDFLAPPPPTATSACTLGTPGAQGPDRITKNLYDNAGQLTKIQKAFGVTTANGFPQTLQQDYVTYAYTNNGKQQFVTDANGNKAQFKYDGFDRLQCWIFPSKTTPGQVSGDCVTTGDYEKYTYDAAGNRLSLRRRDGRTLTFTYDNLSRMLSKVIPNGCPPIQPPGTGCPAAAATRDVFYGYDLLGRQLTAKFDSTGGADGITNAYDGFGNVKSSTVAMAGFSKTVASLYDLDNNRTQVTHPDGQAFTYAYDVRDRLSGLFEGIGRNTPLLGFTWNADDTLATRFNGSGTANYSYDGIGRLTGQSDAFPSSPASNVQWNFQINQASQISSETRSNDGYAFTGISAANKAYLVNGLNQYTAVAGTGHTYDANGNLTGDGINAYIYDGENRLVSATAGGVTTTLTYDSLGRLWQVVKGAANTRFLYDGDAIVAEYDSGGNVTARYVHGNDPTSDDPLIWYVGAGTAVKRFLHADHLDSIVAATNVSSAPTRNAYDEFGIPASGNAGRFQYTGQIWLNEVGLYHYKARLYSPTLGRFLQVDPVGYQDQVNLYSYGGNDPISTNDPLGAFVKYSRNGNDLYLTWINAYYGPGNTAAVRQKFSAGIEKRWNVNTGHYRIHANVIVWTFKPGTEPSKANIIGHPEMNFINVLKYQAGRAYTGSDRFVTIGANKDSWVMAHECGGHCAYLPDLDINDANYDYDIMGGWGNPVTDTSAERLITMFEGGLPPKANKKKAKEPSRGTGNGVNGCPANTAYPLVCGGGIDTWWQ